MRLAAALLALVVLASCGGSPEAAAPEPDVASSTPPGQTGSPTEAHTPRSSPGQGGSSGTEVVVRGSAFGPMLFDASGQAIYLFDVETSDEARCYAECAVAWAPVLSKGVPVAGARGRTGRRDGSTQVTYGGHPLYFYAHEEPGEVECHDVFLNGGFWYVVRPNGARAA